MHAATRRMLNCMYMDMANANAHDFARSFAFARYMQEPICTT
jgi:hypothetical protein